MFIIETAIEKYIKIEPVSTIVVINGAAIIAGSNFNFLANIGNIQPKVLAKHTVAIKVNPKTIDNFKS